MTLRCSNLDNAALCSSTGNPRLASPLGPSSEEKFEHPPFGNKLYWQMLLLPSRLRHVITSLSRNTPSLSLTVVDNPPSLGQRVRALSNSGREIASISFGSRALVMTLWTPSMPKASGILRRALAITTSGLVTATSTFSPALIASKSPAALMLSLVLPGSLLASSVITGLPLMGYLRYRAHLATKSSGISGLVERASIGAAQNALKTSLVDALSQLFKLFVSLWLLSLISWPARLL